MSNDDTIACPECGRKVAKNDSSIRAYGCCEACLVECPECGQPCHPYAVEVMSCCWGCAHEAGDC